MAIVHSLNTWDRRITCVIHPQPLGVVENPRFGGIRTAIGPAGYLVSVAEKPKDADGNVMPWVHHRTEKVTL